MAKKDKRKLQVSAHPYPRTWIQPKLTERRKKIILYCHEYIKIHTWAPSVKEIAEHCKASYSLTLYDLQKLDQMGYIEFQGQRKIKVLYLP